MREIVLDTETTGLDPKSGHRIIEIGAVELLNHIPTGNTYHRYINPEREIDQGAFEVHGLSKKFLEKFANFKNILNLKNKELILPHPRMHKRNFVLLPLFEINKSWKHPKTKIGIANLINSLPIKDLRSIKQL